MTIPNELLAVVYDLAAGKRRWAKVKTLLSWFGKRGRGKHVVQAIRGALTKVQLRTEPDFNSVGSVHTYIEFKSAVDESGNSTKDSVGKDTPTSAGQSAKVGQAASEDDGHPDNQSSNVTGSAFCIGMLPAANRPDDVVTITKNHTVNEAITLMIKNDYSQLPVAQNRATKGYMISWRSIGKARTRNQDCEFVRDCMEKVRTINQDAPLLDAVDRIVRNEVVVVLRHGKITGLVTTTDLSEQYHEYAEPFLLLEEIEERIRQILDEKLTIDDLRDAKHGDGDEREIDDASSLTFGEYVRLLQLPDSWEKLDVSIDQKMFVKLLDEVRVIRNEVMHFRVDSSEDSLAKKLEPLRQLRRLLEHLT